MSAQRKAIAALGCLLVVVAAAGCGEATVGNGQHGSKARAKAGAKTSAAAGGGAEVAAVVPKKGAASARGAEEVADPEESKSFPVQGVIHHKAAATPAKAGEFKLAAGAASEAEVRQELAQMHAAQRSAQQTERQLLKPVSGGESIGGNGTLPIPAGVPEVIQKVVAGANAIADFPYVYGGGHASFVDNAYDCSGSVSYALAAGGLLSAPETSGELESWGAPGPGRYITVYANAGHTYMYVDGVLYDTAGRSGPYASRWQIGGTDNAGYVVRHWPGL